ncbi:MAG: rhodanese-like domain-containing protein [Thermodesulfobacteriota bacterium]
MKKILLTVIALFVAGGMAFAAGHKMVDSDGLKIMMKQEKNLKIVDVREPELFNEGHIPGAINIPYDDAEKRVLKELKKDETIAFVCHGGPMGDELAEILINNNYKKVYNLTGGMRKWNGTKVKN